MAQLKEHTPTFKEEMEKMEKMGKFETIKNMVYVLNMKVDKSQVAYWEKIGYQVQFSGKKKLFGKYIKHLYIYSHGGLSKGPVEEKGVFKAALENEKGNRCTGKQLAALLQKDGYLRISKKELLPIGISQKTLITLMACGAGISQGEQAKLYASVYLHIKKKDYFDHIEKGMWISRYRRVLEKNNFYQKDEENDDEKKDAEENNKLSPKDYRNKYDDNCYLLPDNLETRPFVYDFWDEMTNLEMGYGNIIKRVHAFKTIVLCYESEYDHGLFGLLDSGVEDNPGDEYQSPCLDLDSETITKEQADSKPFRFTAILPEPKSDGARKQSLRLTNDSTSYTSRDQRTRNQNRTRRHQNYPTSNTIRGLRMIAEIQNEQLNSNNAYDINEVFWT